MSEVVGLVLAAGEGSRYGGPKALVRDSDGRAWVRRASDVLRSAGIEKVYVVVGASADDVAALADPRDHRVTAADWQEGMGASLRAGLAAAGSTEAGRAGVALAVVVMLVDLPDVGSEVVRRLSAAAAPEALARATYGGVPGHPVLLGRDHWAAVAASAKGDRGARDYLAAHPTTLVECGDLATGHDVDEPGKSW
jgi:CTP:molybdopterin cytidylyltransferase MocA